MPSPTMLELCKHMPGARRACKPCEPEEGKLGDADVSSLVAEGKPRMSFDFW